jgi:hypothetical protein
VHARDAEAFSLFCFSFFFLRGHDVPRCVRARDAEAILAHTRWEGVSAGQRRRCACVRMYVSMYLCVYVPIYLCLYLCVSLCLCVCVCVCIYIGYTRWEGVSAG